MFPTVIVSLFACTGAFEVLDPQTPYEGRSLGERGADWWKWAWETPATSSAVLDETGDNCAVGQADDVFFLAGSFGGEARRSCTIPAETPVLVPIANIAWDNCGVPLADQLTDDEMADQIDAFLDGLTGLTLQIDGEVIGDSPSALAAHRVDITAFDYVVPEEDSVYAALGVTFSGPCDPSYAGGYYALVDFAPGDHEVAFTAANGDFALDIQYDLTVR